MAEKKQTGKVGDSLSVKAGAEVTRPDGERITVNGGTYVLDVPGVHVVDGEEVTVK